eukprot:236887_1
MTSIMKYSMIIFLLLDLLLICILGYLFTISIFKLIIQIRTTKEKNSLKNLNTTDYNDKDYLQAIEEENNNISNDDDDEIIIDSTEDIISNKHKGTHVRIQTNTSINSFQTNNSINYTLPPIDYQTNINLYSSNSHTLPIN